MKTADLEKLAQEAAAQERASASSNQPRPRAKKAPPPKPIQAPVVRWTPLPVPAAFTYEQAEARIQIREFCVRFYDDIHLEKTMIEELELVDGDAIEEDAINNDDGAVSVTWVGEECVRELMAHLLDVMATDEDDLPRRRVKFSFRLYVPSSHASPAHHGRGEGHSLQWRQPGRHVVRAEDHAEQLRLGRSGLP
jgi:hypothetical protein